MNAKRSLTFVSVLMMLIAASIKTNAQGGPSFTVTFNPPDSAQVGTSVDIHVQVHASTYGASKITVSCDGVSKTETSELDYHSTWRTSGCQPGGASVQVCAKTAADEQWMQANCQSFGYQFTGSTNIPSGQFWADTDNLQPSQCTNMHWRVNEANVVKVEGNVVGANGDQQICPTVTKKYNLEAVNSAGTLYLNFSVTVTTVPQPQPQRPTDAPQLQPTRPIAPPPPPQPQPQPSGCGPRPSRLRAGDIALVSDYDPLPLEVYNERDVRSGIKFTVPVKQPVSIIQGASCSYGMTWVEVGYRGRGGWAIEVNSSGYYNLIPNGMPLPGPGGRGGSRPVQPTAVPPTQVPPTPVPPTPVQVQPTATQQPEAQNQPTSDPCDESTTYDNSDGFVLLVYAADQPQCASYVREKYPVFFDCLWNAGWHRSLDEQARNTDQWAGASNTAIWARKAPNCSLAVKNGNDPSLELNSLAPTEWLMVWSPGCEDTGDVGHIGIYLGQYDYKKQEVYIDESNWEVNKYPTGPRRRPLPQKDLRCITFIHVGLPPGNKQVAGNNQQGGDQNNSGGNNAPQKQYPPFPQLTKTWTLAYQACVRCSLGNVLGFYVQFLLLPKQYVEGDVLHFAYLDPQVTVPYISMVPIPLDGGMTAYRFMLDRSTVDQLAKTLKLTSAQLEEAGAWYVTPIKTR